MGADEGDSSGKAVTDRWRFRPREDVTVTRPRAAASPPAEQASMYAFLRGVKLFAALGDADVAELAGAAQPKSYERDETIIRQGDPGDSLLIVQSGEVQVVLERNASKTEALSVLKAGGVGASLSCQSGSST